MSTTNENILKSLAALEGNLKDIDSAKEQVNNVVKSSGDLANVIESYKASFEGVSKNLKTVLREIKSANLNTISALSMQTELFNKEVTRLTEFDFTNSFDSIESKVIEQFGKDLKKQLAVIDEQSKSLQDKIDEFKSQISRIEAIDLETHFATLIADFTNQNNEVKLQNETLLTETKTNRILLIVATIIIVGLIIINLILK